MPLYLKGLCLLIVGLFVLMGIVGLILPIIPGILFLFLAALLLAKVSSSFDAALNRNKHMRYWRRRWDTTNNLPLLQRIKLSFWIVAKAAVNGVEAALKSLNKMRGDR
ncbi:MAG: DUF454 family protein [Pseudohongiellaceae bacterium]